MAKEGKQQIQSKHEKKRDVVAHLIFYYSRCDTKA